MDFNTDLWDDAENDFQNWLFHTETGSNELTGILRATFLVNRKKLRESIGRLHDSSIWFLAEKGLVSEPDFLYDRSSRIMFSLAEPDDKEEAERWENEQKKRNLKRNKEIVSDILSGKQLVINDIYEDEFPKIVRMVIQNSGNIENAKDIFQDGLVVLIENIFHKKVDLTASFESYLYGICRLLWLNQLKQKRKVVKFKDDYSYDNSEFCFMEIETNEDNYEKISGIIESMGNPCQKLLKYYYYQKMNWEDIAEQLGYATAGSARNQKYKCLERIRKQLAEINEN
jgi:RNA polymerase sigma factor (sigma-70 family)